MPGFSLRTTWSPFVAVTVTVIPEAKDLQPAAWRDFRELVEETLSKKSKSVQWQVKVFIHLLQILPLLRYGKPLSELADTSRVQFLTNIENSRFILFRRGFWGIRTLALLGYYGRQEAAAEIGYAAHPKGWKRK